MRMDPLAMEILLGCWWVGGFRLLVISIRCHDDGNVWLFLELRWRRGGRLDTEGSVSTVWVETVLPASLASSAMSWIRTMGKWSMGRSIIDYWLVSCPHYYANLFPSLHFCPLSNPQGGMERKGAAKAPSFPSTNLYLNSPEHRWARAAPFFWGERERHLGKNWVQKGAALTSFWKREREERERDLLKM